MFDTVVTVVGNVLTVPEWRRTANTNTLVANFKVASTARRFDKDTGVWVDSNSLRVRVNCWRKLAEGVAASVRVGDPVVVVGRLYTRDWTDTEGNARTMYELEAMSVGHDLARGRARFQRNRTAQATSEVEGEETDQVVRGEASAPVADPPVRPGELFDEPDFPAVPSTGPHPFDPATLVRGGGFDPDGTADDLDPLDSDDPRLEPLAEFGPGAGTRSSDGESEDEDTEAGATSAPSPGPQVGPPGRPSRRGRSRVPVPA
jgi:single-strand DNA-binding protein